MTGHLDAGTINDFENCFRTNCLILIGEAYKWLKETKDISIDWDEENISANIFTHIDESEKAIAWNITVSDECRLYHQAILNNKRCAKSASRIDFKLSTIHAEETKRVYYYIEAKILIENDCIKQGRKTKLTARRTQGRYISTGINHLLSGEYPPNSCMLGYVLEGNTAKIVEKINKILLKATRGGEILKKEESEIAYLDAAYISVHPNNCIFHHYFLHF